MKERPILMNGAMVRATVRERDPKTQTRRPVKGIALDWLQPGMFTPEYVATNCPCPYGVPGDRLWVREAWRVGKPNDTTRPRDILPPLIERGQGVTVLYEAGGWRSIGPEGREEPIYPHDTPMPEWAGKLRPSMFMPRAFSRIALEVTGVRVERLQSIREDDARFEGVTIEERHMIGYCAGEHYPPSIRAFRDLWDGLAAPGAEWAANPWVWVVEFQRVDA